MYVTNLSPFEVPCNNKVVPVRITNLGPNTTNSFFDDNDLTGKYLLGFSLPAYLWGTDIAPNGDPTPTIAELRRLVLDMETFESKSVAIDGVPLAQFVSNPGTGGFAWPTLVRFRDGLPVSLSNSKLTNPNNAPAIAVACTVPFTLWYTGKAEAMLLRRHRAAQMAVQIAAAEGNRVAKNIYEEIMDVSTPW
jgi:hypothetical protein